MWPSDAIWWHRSGSALAEVMACCLQHQAITWTNLDFSLASFHDIHLRNLTAIAVGNILYNELENYALNITAISLRGQWVKTIWYNFSFLFQERHAALEKMGISVQTSGIKVEKNKYYLVNLNADPSLNELLVYYLKVREKSTDCETLENKLNYLINWCKKKVGCSCVITGSFLSRNYW